MSLRRFWTGRKLPYPVEVQARDYEAETESQRGTEVFETPNALGLARARLEHLEWMDLPVEGKSVLDVGCGTGHLASFFLRKKCRVVGVDGREENIAGLRERYPEMEAHVADVQAGLSQFGRFDVVFSYGLLYHLEDPVAGLRNMAAVCGELLLLETMVSDHTAPLVRYVDEAKLSDQALRGIGCRPTPSFITMVLSRAGFPYVYAPTAVPMFPDFKIAWKNSLASEQDSHPLRCVFVASKKALASPKLVSLLKA